jgi:hypothetical protein
LRSRINLSGSCSSKLCFVLRIIDQLNRALLLPAGTKVIGSLGPATHTADVLAKMMGAGMAAARLDLTWGPLDFHMKSLEALNVSSTNMKSWASTQAVGAGARNIKYPQQFEGQPNGQLEGATLAKHKYILY